MILPSVLAILTSREKRQIWTLSVADVFVNLLDIAFLIGLLFVVNFYTQAVHPPYFHHIPNALFERYPLLLIGCFLLLFSLKNMAGFFISKEQFHFVYDVSSRISKDNLSRFLRGSYTEYVNIDSSVMNRKISQQPTEFCHYVLNGLQQLFSQLVLVIFTFAAIMTYNPLLIPLLMLIMTPAILLIGIMMKRRMEKTRFHGKKTSEKAIQHLQEALAGYVESNIYQKNDFFTDRYYRLQSKLNRYLSDRLIIQHLPPRLIEVFAVFGLFVLIGIHSFGGHRQPVQLVTIGALMIAAYKIIPGIVRIMNLAGQIKTYAFTVEGLALPDLTPVVAQTAEEIHSVIFERVNFSYSQKQVLRDFSLQMRKGDMIGVNGLSGRGKTTFINLLLGFLTPQSGSICINEEVADTDKLKSFWRSIAYIKQQSFFLHASIRENITLENHHDGACHDIHRDEKRLEKVICIAGIRKMICSLPEGLNTIMTENGKNFSGGQKQRVVLARALYKDAGLIILDEPFNELDECSENQMLKQLSAIAHEGKIIVLITHNREALAYCNKKIWMDE